VVEALMQGYPEQQDERDRKDEVYGLEVLGWLALVMAIAIAGFVTWAAA
jgi:hypothetical protein